MQNWRTRLDHWVRVWDRLPELTRDCFPVHPPSGTSWPEGIPSCAALTDFYTRCDGGTFGPYTLSPMAELTDPSTDKWSAGLPGLELKLGRWLELGNHEYGHMLLWDADADEVLLYSPDDEEPRRFHRTIEEFFARLFRPSVKASNEATQMWREALAEADKLAP